MNSINNAKGHDGWYGLCQKHKNLSSGQWMELGCRAKCGLPKYDRRGAAALGCIQSRDSWLPPARQSRVRPAIQSKCKTVTEETLRGIKLIAVPYVTKARE